MLQAVSRSPFGQVMRQVPCDVCGGDGRVPETPCERCDGRGREVRRRTVAVDVPAGIADGQRIRLSGHGHAGERGGPAGDLYVRVHVRPDERFMRDGDNLVTVLDVSPPQAALGAELEVPSLDGSHQVQLPAGTQPGEILRVRGQGMPVLRRPGRRGDLHVVVNVVIPRRLSREQRDLMERLAATMRPEDLRSDESVLGRIKRLLGG
jgi:molecular chaperone DnaJ